MLDERVCEFCGKLYIPRQENQRACGPECRKKLRVEDNKRLRENGYATGVCPICGKKTDGHRKYCSEACRMVGSKLKALENGYDVEVPDLAVSPCVGCSHVRCTTHCMKFERWFIPKWDALCADLRQKLKR